MTTPEQIEAVARMRLMIQSAVEDDARAWELTDTELAVIAEAAISAMRPFIRAEALEEARGALAAEDERHAQVIIEALMEKNDPQTS